MNQWPLYKILNHQTPRRNHRCKLLWFWIKQWFLKYWKRNSTGLWSLKGVKQRKVTSATKSAYFLEAISRLGHRKGNPHTACSLAEWKRGRLEFREAARARICRRVTDKRELHWNLKKGPFKSLAKCQSTHAWEETTQGWGRILRMKFLELTSSWK